MSKVTLTTITPTYALKAKRLLKSYGISAEVVKVAQSKKEGCNSGIKVDDKDLHDVTSIFKNAGIKYSIFTER